MQTGKRSQIKPRKPLHEEFSTQENSPEVVGEKKDTPENLKYSSSESEEENISEEENESPEDSLKKWAEYSGDTTGRGNVNTLHFRLPAGIKLQSASIPEIEKPADNRKLINYVLIVFAVITAGYAIFRMCNKPNTIENKISCYDALRENQPIQNDGFWTTVTVGFENLLNGMDDRPVVFLFTHKGNKSALDLVKNIANESTKCFGTPMELVEMTSDDFTSEDAINDHSYVIEKYKNRIKESNIALIANLNEIPPNASRALQYICDTYSPLIKKVIIFLTLEVQPKPDQIPKKVALDVLNELWSELPSNILDPLITRVTDQVIALNS